MQMNQRLEDLVKEPLSLFPREGCVSLGSHVLFQIELEVLKDQVQLVLTVDDLFQPAVNMKQKMRIRRISNAKQTMSETERKRKKVWMGIQWNSLSHQTGSFRRLTRRRLDGGGP